MATTGLKSFFHPSAFKAGILCIILSCLIWFSFGHEQPQFFKATDARISDTMFRVRGSQDSSGSVVIVDIDDNSLKTYGQWPWPRNVIAELVDTIFDSKPLVVGFDIMFAERDRTSPSLFFEKYRDRLTLKDPNDRVDPSTSRQQFQDHDLLLAKAIQGGQSVLGYMFLFREDFLKSEGERSPHTTLDISIEKIGIEFKDLKLITAYRPILNIAEVSTGTSTGFLNAFPDPDGFIRKVPLFFLMDDQAYPSMSLEMYRIASGIHQARIHLNNRIPQPYQALDGVSLGDSYFKTDDYCQLGINFRGPDHTFLYLSASDVLQGAATQLLKDKFVLLGSSAGGIKDIVATPFSSRLPGVEVQANVLDNLIQKDAMVWENQSEKTVTYLGIIVGGLLICSSLIYLGPLSGLLLSFATIFSIVVCNYYLLFLENRLLGTSFLLTSLTAVFITVVLFNYLFEGRRRNFIRKAFSHYVSPSIVNELLKHPEKLDLQVDSREVSILFCDIRNFTSLAENSCPEKLSSFLNSYFSLMTDIIIKNKGMVDKYIGDAVMAVWGSPLHDPDHATNAVQAALEMVEALRQSGDDLQLAGHGVAIGIGINSGTVSAGNFGCERRFDYTVLGDSVNLASRVEEQTKKYPVEILITEYTQKLLPANSNSRFIDTVVVKGRKKPVILFEPLYIKDATRD